jgi:hexosaminidase
MKQSFQKTIFASCILLLKGFLAVAQFSIVPAPVELTPGKGKVHLPVPVVIATSGTGAAVNDPQADYLAMLLKSEGINTQKGTALLPGRKFNGILLQYITGAAEESYSIKAQGTMVVIAGGPAGIFYGLQTLRQIWQISATQKAIQIPVCTITDHPRFAYRGMHLDVARHFFAVDQVKRYIDLLALYKYNRFHWHLTDDQGWRIEIKKYPRLTQTGGWRNGTIIGRYPGSGNTNTPYGGFYTQEQIKAVVRYAAERHITVIPEIEMPGHSSAAIAAYPQLSCFPDEPTTIPGQWVSAASKQAKGKLVQETWGVFEDVYSPTEYTFSFLQDVLDEVIALFPSNFIHIGGDECPKEAWKRSAFCQQLIKDKNLKDEHGLQSYFIQRIEKYVNSKGRTIIGWDEILEGGLAPNASVMSWRGEEGGIAAAKEQHTVVMTPGSHCYFDHSQSANEDSVTIGSYLPLHKVYGYEPVPAALSADEAKYVLGAQGNVWTEYITNLRKLDYMVFPRLMALAEVLWTPAARHDYARFERALKVQLRRLDQSAVHYSRAFMELETRVAPGLDLSRPNLIWRITNKATDHFVELTTPDKKTLTLSFKQSRVTDVLIEKPGLYSLELVSIEKAGPTRNIRKVVDNVSEYFHFHKATGIPVTLTHPPSAKYAADGAFTVVNGIISEKGFAKSGDYLGFDKTDAEVLLDFNNPTELNTIIVHALSAPAQWIWAPRQVSVYAADAPGQYRLVQTDSTFHAMKNGTGSINVSFPPVRTRYLKVVITRQHTIPEGNPGAGNGAWLFVDEIEVN